MSARGAVPSVAPGAPRGRRSPRTRAPSAARRPGLTLARCGCPMPPTAPGAGGWPCCGPHGARRDRFTGAPGAAAGVLRVVRWLDADRHAHLPDRWPVVVPPGMRPQGERPPAVGRAGADRRRLTKQTEVKIMSERTIIVCDLC